jgi:hypothetical protein
VDGDTEFRVGDLVVALVPTEYESQLRDVM